MIVGTMPKQVEYALMVLSDMHKADPGRLFSVRELSDCHDVPFDVLSKTMQQMARAGFVRSVQGVHGGYQLITALSKVTLLNLMESLLGNVATVNCLKEGRKCPREDHCNVYGSMQVLDLKLRDFYDGITIHDLVEEGRQESITE